MLPVLFESDETKFTTQGTGTLSDSVKCVVKEERNGKFELTMQYPVGGVHYSDIAVDKIVYAKYCPDKERQSFRIYHISRPIGGIVTIDAEHISYQLTKIPCAPFSASTAKEAVAGLKTNAIEPCPFSFFTDLTTEASYAQATPASIRERLGGVEGSILDVYGGEYEWDMYTVKLWKARGKNRGVTLRYAKNITDITQDESIESTITGIVPYWKGTEGDGEDNTEVVVTVPGYVVESAASGDYAYPRTVVVDFSDYFESRPTQAQLLAKAKEYVKNIGIATVNNEIDIYDNDDPLYLCDTVTVQYPSLGVSATAKIISTEFDVLADRYTKVEVGDIKSSMSRTVNDLSKAVASATSSTAEVVGSFTALRADYANFKNVSTSDISANTASINALKTTLTDTQTLIAGKADITDLDAINGRIDNLDSTYATVDLANVKQGSITTAMIGDGVVGTAQIADASVTDAKIVGLAASKITAGKIDAGVIDVVNLNADNITAGTINGERISDGAIVTNKLKDDAVTTDKIESAAITADLLAADSVTAEKIVSRTITADKLAAKTIMANSGIIADAAITNAMIANLDAAKITSGTIDADRIGAGSITADKIAADAIVVGGQNLLRGTGLLSEGDGTWSSASWCNCTGLDEDTWTIAYSHNVGKNPDYPEGCRSIVVICFEDSVEKTALFEQTSIPVPTEEAVILSAWLCVNTIGEECTLTLTGETSGIDIISSTVVPTDTEWHRYTFKGTVPETDEKATLVFSGKPTKENDQFWLFAPMLERGTNVSDWAPSYYDTSVSNVYYSGTTEIDGAKIRTGSLSAGQITTGKIQDSTGKNYWNLESGEFVAGSALLNGVLDIGIDDNGASGNVTINSIGFQINRTNENGTKVYATLGSPSGLYVSNDDYNAQFYPDSIRILYGSDNNSTDTTKTESNGTCFVVNVSPAAMKIVLGENSVSSGNSYSSIFSVIYNSLTKEGQTTIRTSASVSGDFSCYGTKSRISDTDDYGERLLYCYETPSPMFGDIGESMIGDDGSTYIQIDPIFLQTINTSQYQVFLQAYGQGECYVSERKGSYFVVKGTPGLSFGWEIKAKQSGYEQIRMSRKTEEANTDSSTNYLEEAETYLKSLEKERTEA